MGEGDRLTCSSVAIRVAGEDYDLHAGGLGAEDIEDTFLADGVGVHQNVVEDEDLGFVDGQFLGDGEAEAEEELFFGSLRELVKGVGGFAGAADAVDLEVFVEEDFAGGVAGEFGEGGREAVFQGGENGLGRGLFAVLNQVVGEAGAPGLGAGGVAAEEGLGAAFFEFGFAGVEALAAEGFEFAFGFVAFGAEGSEFVGDLLESGGGAFGAFGEFVEVGREFDFGRGHAGLGLGEGEL